jgi:signal transduction histidine kinase
LGVALVAAGVPCLVSTGLIRQEAARAHRDKLVAQADLLAAAMGGALEREDGLVAQQVLESLAEAGGILGACAYDRGDKPVATFLRATGAPALPERPGVETYAWLDGHLSVTRPVRRDGQPVGTLLLVAGGPERGTEGLGALLASAGVLLLVVAVVRWVSSRAQRWVWDPLGRFTADLGRVALEGDYGTRFTPSGISEIEALAQPVNRLLAEISFRDESLECQRQELEQQVLRRTADLTRENRERQAHLEQMEQSKLAAQAASRTKSEFLARMSHELRTPMHGMLGMTDLLLRTRLDAQQRRSAATVRRLGGELLGLVNDILDFSKLEAGRLELESTTLDPRELLDDTLDLLAGRARDKGLELVGEVSDAVPTRIDGDPQRLRQILINLIGNGIKFTEQGEILVRVGSVHENSRSAVLRFEVADTGKGVPPRLQDRIFDSFAQGDRHTVPGIEGTGLGLAICKQLALLMKGEIGVESRPGQGATFWFTACFEAPRHDPEQHVASGRALEGLRALVVEGNDSLRQCLRRRLASWGVLVEETQTTEEIPGQADARSRKCDVVTLCSWTPMRGATASSAPKQPRRPSC